MSYYHIKNNIIISGPHTVQSDYVRKLTRCGTPEVLDLSEYDLVPEVREPLGPDQTYDEPIVSETAVTFPARNKTADEIAAELTARRTGRSCSKA